MLFDFWYEIKYNIFVIYLPEQKLIYATTNQAKLNMMRNFLAPLNIEISGIEKPLPEVEEGEKSPLLNARKKAAAYYKILNSPVFSCDSGLFFEGLPEEFQPRTNVRTVGGKRLSDEEMIDYYSALAKRFGKITAQYRNAICLILNDNQVFEYDGEDLYGEKFLLSEAPHERRVQGFPIDSLSINIVEQKYYFDLPVRQRGFSMEKGFQDFFIKVFDNKKRK